MLHLEERVSSRIHQERVEAIREDIFPSHLWDGCSTASKDNAHEEEMLCRAHSIKESAPVVISTIRGKATHEHGLAPLLLLGELSEPVATRLLLLFFSFPRLDIYTDIYTLLPPTRFDICYRNPTPPTRMETGSPLVPPSPPRVDHPRNPKLGRALSNIQLIAHKLD